MDVAKAGAARLPVLLGGNTAKALPRVVAFADEWMPHRIPAEDLPGHIDELQRLAAAAGREPIPVTVFGAASDPSGLSRLEAAGAHRAVLLIPTGDRDQALPILDCHAGLVEAGV
jgi:alkanesulfonate monooxygenase SsuD/methylene tetrahydromethanopterin reductase-like flavin-dependent oxidoreductase (luciferase family)